MIPIPTQYKAIAAAVLAAFIFAAGLKAGYSYRDAQCDATVAGMALDQAKSDITHADTVIEIQTDQSAVTTQVTTNHETTRAQREETAQTVDNEVATYENETPANDRCALAPGWVRAHNLSAGAAGDPETSGSSAGADGATARAPSDVEALRVVTRNYRQCLSEFDKLRALQDWYIKQQAASQGGSK